MTSYNESVTELKKKHSPVIFWTNKTANKPDTFFEDHLCVRDFQENLVSVNCYKQFNIKLKNLDAGLGLGDKILKFSCCFKFLGYDLC